MTATQKAAHRYAEQKRASYVSKFNRPVAARAADGVYVAAYVDFLRRAAA